MCPCHAKAKLDGVDRTQGRQDGADGGHGVERDAHRLGSRDRECPVDDSGRLVGVVNGALRVVAINQTRGSWALNQS